MVKRPMLQQALHLGRFLLQRLFVASLTAAWTLGCAADVRERTVSDVTLLETSPSALDTDDVLGGLVTAEPRTFLWIETERDVYDANLVSRDLERIERFYRAQGYYDVKVIAARVRPVGERKVAIEVRVTPGPRVTVREVMKEGVLALDPEVGLIQSAVPPPLPGAPFTEETLDAYKSELERALREAGYAYAKVKVTATVDLNARAADIKTELRPGKRARFGEIRVRGLKKIPETKVRAILGLQQGARYSEAAQEEARSALENMDRFARAEVTPDLSDPERDEVPILVSLQEDDLRKLTLGGGTILDALKLELHVRTDWEHKNFLGGARRLSIESKVGGDIFPNRLETLDTVTATPTNVFLVMNSSVTLEQPSIFNGRTSGSATVRFARGPQLYPLLPDTDPRDEKVVGFNVPSAKLALKRSFLKGRVLLEPSYNLQARIPYSAQNEVTGVDTVWVSYPRIYALLQTKPGDIDEWFRGLSGANVVSRKRDKNDLRVAFSSSIELAGLRMGSRYALGGSVSDVKLEPELRIYAPLSGERWHDEQQVGNWILASRLKLGLILAPDYGTTLRTDRQRAAAAGGTDASNLDQQKLLARAFYSGGSTSNRGYAQNAISPHGPIGFLLPASINCNLAVNREDARCIRPLGGFTLWEASLELRWAGFYPFTLVAFADASDVTRDLGVLQFKYPHLSVGPGLRYQSPVGPIRLDFGVRVPGLQAMGERELPLAHGQERPWFFGKASDRSGLPAAIHLAFGDAF